MVQEFLKFIQRGNVIDLAVAVIIGGAFGAITTSLVNDVAMPLVGLVLGGVNFTALSFGIGGAQIMYGNFIQSVINFLIIALVIFLVLKAYNRMLELGRKKQEAPAAPPVPPREQVLLEEIRDLLAKQAKS